MTQHRQLRTFPLLLLSALIAAVGLVLPAPIGVAANAEVPEAAGKGAPSVAQYRATRTADGFRVTLLGMTKGVAFLASQDLVDVGGRAPGNNAVPWMRVTALVESLDDEKVPADIATLDVQTAEGQSLVETLTVQSHGVSRASRASGTARMDLDFQHVEPILFPTAVPKGVSADRSCIFAFTLSGRFREAETANLCFRIGPEGQQTTLAFEDVPLP